MILIWSFSRNRLNYFRYLTLLLLSLFVFFGLSNVHFTLAIATYFKFSLFHSYFTLHWWFLKYVPMCHIVHSHCTYYLVNLEQVFVMWCHNSNSYAKAINDLEKSNYIHDTLLSMTNQVVLAIMFQYISCHDCNAIINIWNFMVGQFTI